MSNMFILPNLILGRGKTVIGLLVMASPWIARAAGMPVPPVVDPFVIKLGGIIAGAGAGAKALRFAKWSREQARVIALGPHRRDRK